jgi:uncharacterized protein YmfQ (DUF2313 family)
LALTSEQYLRQLQALLPTGAAWPREDAATLTKVLHSLADELARIDLRADDLLDEADVRTAGELLSDWERVLGLPDGCTLDQTLSVDDRRRLAWAKLAEQGGQSRVYFIELAERYGIPGCTITEFRQATCNSHCNDALYSQADEFAWRLNVPIAAAATRPANCNDHCNVALQIYKPNLVECPISGRKPAHTNVLFAYESPVLALDFTSEVPDPHITFSGANGTRVNGAGLIVPANAPRIDYDPVTLACKGLLIEEERTNLLKYSDNFNRNEWGVAAGNFTAVDSGIASPIAGKNWQLLTVTTTAPTNVSQNVAGAGAAAGNTFSVYVKKGSKATGQFNFYNGTTGVGLFRGSMNFDTGVWSTQGGAGACVVNSLGGGAYRLQLTNLAGVSAGDALRVYVGWPGNLEVAGSTMYAIGAQLEAGAFTSSYIPTAAAAVTRTADRPLIAGVNFSDCFNPQEGTFVVEFYPSNGEPFPHIFEVADAANQDRIGLDLDAARVLVPYGDVDGVGTALFDYGSVGSVNYGAVNKVALAYGLPGFAAALNGAVAQSAGQPDPRALSQMVLGQNIAGAANAFLNGHVRGLRYYSKRLSNARLQALTAA